MSDHIYLDHDTIEESLAAQLPEFMPKDPESGNYKFLSTIADRIDAYNSDIESVDRAKTPQTADTIEQLEEIARLVDLKPYQDETLEHFRARVISEFQLVTSKGTVRDLMNATATILDAEVDTIRYTEEHVPETGVCQLGVPSKQMNEVKLSDSEFVKIVDQLIPSSYTVDLYKSGTFTYISTSDWINTRRANNTGTFTFISSTAYGNSNHDPVKGHDGLDTSGNPKDNGGTYSGIAESGTGNPDLSYDGLDNSGNPNDSGGTYAGIIN